MDLQGVEIGPEAAGNIRFVIGGTLGDALVRPGRNVVAWYSVRTACRCRAPMISTRSRSSRPAGPLHLRKVFTKLGISSPASLLPRFPPSRARSIPGVAGYQDAIHHRVTATDPDGCAPVRGT
jgi:hypothetical protein